MELLSLTQHQAPVKTTEDAIGKQYEFWNTQPVPKIGKSLEANDTNSGNLKPVHCVLCSQMKK